MAASTVDDDTQPDVQPSQPIVRGANVHSYRLGTVLGRGGMGEVVLAHDPALSRDIAIKRMRTSSPTPEALARFEREARIQARLDHPAIVPVHEIGRDERGEPYFTMKRLAGTTLAEVLAHGSATPQKLLRALVDICLAIELAHQRQIVHRDLKPANIMLGDYGEVYVLDWGVARVLDRDLVAQSEVGTEPGMDEVAGTQTGSLLGTPGYMAPEQVRGEDVGPAADVYALGAILFEILTGTRLHPSGVAALASTLELDDPSPARRFPERGIAPELDAACTAALARAPAARPSARGLADRIQQYLDGDRDLEARRGLADSELGAARAALAEGRRADAVHHAGRAVAFDPHRRDAVALLTSLIVEPPRELPSSVLEAAATEEERQRRERSRRALVPFLSVPVAALLFGIVLETDRVELAVQAGVALVMALFSFVNWRVRPIPTWVYMIGQLVFALAMTRWAGPFVMMPSVLFALVLALVMQPWANARPKLVLGWALAVMATPLLLEGAGLISATWDQNLQGLVSYGAIVPPGTPPRWLAITAVISMHFAALIVFTRYALAVTRDARHAQRALFVQAWHLRQLLPREPAAPP